MSGDVRKMLDLLIGFGHGEPCFAQGASVARRVELGLKHLDFDGAFSDLIIEFAVSEDVAGQTPVVEVFDAPLKDSELVWLTDEEVSEPRGHGLARVVFIIIGRIGAGVEVDGVWVFVGPLVIAVS